MTFRVNTDKRFYIHWTDIPGSYNNGALSCNTYEAAVKLAAIRVAFSDVHGTATVTDTAAPRDNRQVLRVKWVGLEVWAYKLDGYKWRQSHAL